MFKNVPLPEDHQIPENLLSRLKQLPAINIYRLLTTVPDCFNPWLDLVAGLYQVKFDKRLKEIAICRQAYKAKSHYELHQHKFIAKQNGVTDKELQAVLTEDIVHSLDEEANFICKVADEIEVNATLTDVSFNELFTRYGVQLGMELIVTISFYCCVARVLNATRTPIEETNPLEGLATPINKQQR